MTTVLTKNQQKSLKNVWLRQVGEDSETGKKPCSYLEFRRNVQMTVGCDNAVVVPFAGFFLCIETDGYCHS